MYCGTGVVPNRGWFEKTCSKIIRQTTLWKWHFFPLLSCLSRQRLQNLKFINSWAELKTRALICHSICLCGTNMHECIECIVNLYVQSDNFHNKTLLLSKVSVNHLLFSVLTFVYKDNRIYGYSYCSACCLLFGDIWVQLYEVFDCLLSNALMLLVPLVNEMNALVYFWNMPIVKHLNFDVASCYSDVWRIC